MSAAEPLDRRVVVTGVGVVSPIGTDVGTFWRGLVAGQSGISRPSGHEANGDPEPAVAAVQNFGEQIEAFGPLEKDVRKKIRKALRLMNRETQMAVAAAQQAVAESGLSSAGFDPERVGVCFGSGNAAVLPEDFLPAIQACTDDADQFDAGRWGIDGLPQVAPLWLLTCLSNMPACRIAIFNNLQGPNNSITQREASANLAVGEAMNLIADGEADAMIVGATGTTILPFNRLHEVLDREVAIGDSDPATLCRPFDRRRCGSVLGEGAASVVLEELQSALRRGVPIYGEVTGTGASCVVDRGRVPHCDSALANSIRSALRRAGRDPESVGHVQAHGLSTRRSDRDEARAIRNLFGPRADTLPIAAAKSGLGNSGAGSGALELVAGLLALKHGHLFPVLNYEEPDPECPVSAVTSADVPAGGSFLNLSVSSQGQAGCVLVESFE